MLRPEGFLSSEGFIRNLARGVATVSVVALTMSATSAVSARAAVTGPAWSIHIQPQPTNFSVSASAGCETVVGEGPECDGYTVTIQNVGSAPSTGPVVISELLPPGMKIKHIEAHDEVPTQTSFGCSKKTLRCVDEAEVPVGDTLIVAANITVEPGATGSLRDSASVSGGGAATVATSVQTPVSETPAPFGIESFQFVPRDSLGAPESAAGGHPATLTTGFNFTTQRRVENGIIHYVAKEEVKDVIVDLPLGFVGNPQVTPKCTLSALLLDVELTSCPAASRIGTLVFEAAPGRFRVSESGEEATAIYNLVPEEGFAAQFGFTYLGKPVIIYGGVVRVGSRYMLRVTVPGVPELRTIGATLTFFGNPALRDGGATPSAPFFTNPVDCSSGPLSARMEVDTWQHPGVYHSAESVAYPDITACGLLAFTPSLAVTPEATQADAPTGLGVSFAFPQIEDPEHVAAPPLRNVTITLPPGVSINAGAADGLVGCPAEGPEGINLNEEQPGPDGLNHPAPGHCPAASTIGTVEVSTPLLPEPLRGHLYAATPGCGGPGQAPCTPHDAVDGNLFGGYLEAAGQGVVVKVHGSLSANPATGQLTGSFDENPPFPVSSANVQVKGGPRAILATPPTCGPATSSADISPWSAPFTPDGTPSSSFPVSWDGAGTPCPATLPFSPSLVAQTTQPTAAAFSPFTMTIARNDREQSLSALQLTLPVGLDAILASVPLCGEPDAAQGTCPAASQVGTTTTAAGAGSHPLYLTGRVYLTGPYHGAPFGLSVVVPAVAGPFNLGNVTVRAAITVDPNTTAVTVTSDPFPQIIDGVPLRLRTVNVTIDRPGFTFNPTNCTTKTITATIASNQGTASHPTTPFTAAGCKNLPFKPTFTATTKAKTSKLNGASLTVKVSSAAGQANIAQVHLQLPKILPSRLTTLQKACTDAQFNVNPAGCPAGATIGYAKAITPVLNAPLVGPAILVSHGGAAFPDVEFLLQGQGVTVVLDGKTQIKGGVTYSHFDTVPDAPITSFETVLPQGPHSILAAFLPAKANGSLCSTSLTMPTTITAQNGAVVKQTTRIAVTGCPTAKKANKGARHAQRASSGLSRTRTGR
jgi:hypothetical protein